MSKLKKFWAEHVAANPFLAGAIGGIGITFLGIIAAWALVWLIDFLPWPK